MLRYLAWSEVKQEVRKSKVTVLVLKEQFHAAPLGIQLDSLEVLVIQNIMLCSTVLMPEGYSPYSLEYGTYPSGLMWMHCFQCQESPARAYSLFLFTTNWEFSGNIRLPLQNPMKRVTAPESSITAK